MNWSLSENKNWAYLEQNFDWVADMRGVKQDPIHHAEGDVAVHTEMVLKSLTALPFYQTLSPQDKEVLWASALLHDVEKRSTTVIEKDGRVTSAGHAKKGEFTTRQILFRDMAAPFRLREQIASLVRYHGLPLWITEKRDPQKAAIEASLRVDTSLLSTLARADVLGRVCHDQQDMIDRVDFFEAYCEEQACWKKERSFNSGLARFNYFKKDDSSPDYEPFDDLKGEVVMICGLPGMGKDRYIRKHYADWPVISLDDIRRANKLKPDDVSATGWVVQQAKEQSKVFLRKGQPFVWNATSITRQMRTQWIDLFASYKARVKLVYIEVPYHDWLRQNNEREHVVPHNVLMRLLDKLEVPVPHEAHDVIYEVRE